MKTTIQDIEKHFDKIRNKIGKDEWDNVLFSKPMNTELHNNMLKEFFLNDSYLLALEKASISKNIDFLAKEAGKRWKNKFQTSRIEFEKNINDYELSVTKFEEESKFQILDEEIDIRKLYSYYYNQDPKKPERNKIAIEQIENHFAVMTKHREKLHRMKRDTGNTQGIDYFELKCGITGFSSKTILEFIRVAIEESKQESLEYESWMKTNYNHDQIGGSCKELDSEVNPIFKPIDCVNSMKDVFSDIGLLESFNKINFFKKEDYKNSADYCTYETYEAPDNVKIFIPQFSPISIFDTLYHEVGHLIQNTTFSNPHWIFSENMVTDDEICSSLVQLIYLQPEWIKRFTGITDERVCEKIKYSSIISNIPWVMINSCLGFLALDLCYDTDVDVIPAYNKIYNTAYSYQDTQENVTFATSLAFGGSAFKGVNYATGYIVANFLMDLLRANCDSIFDKKMGEYIKEFARNGNLYPASKILGRIIEEADNKIKIPKSIEVLLVDC
jgi:hypothetical protein